MSSNFPVFTGVLLWQASAAVELSTILHSVAGKMVSILLPTMLLAQKTLLVSVLTGAV